MGLGGGTVGRRDGGGHGPQAGGWGDGPRQAPPRHMAAPGQGEKGGREGRGERPTGRPQARGPFPGPTPRGGGESGAVALAYGAFETSQKKRCWPCRTRFPLDKANQYRPYFTRGVRKSEGRISRRVPGRVGGGGGGRGPQGRRRLVGGLPVVPTAGGHPGGPRVGARAAGEGGEGADRHHPAAGGGAQRNVASVGEPNPWALPPPPAHTARVPVCRTGMPWVFRGQPLPCGGTAREPRPPGASIFNLTQNNHEDQRMDSNE